MDSNNRKDKRALFVAEYIESANKKGVKVTHSVDILANRILFITERQIYKDLRRAGEIRVSNKY